MIIMSYTMLPTDQATVTCAWSALPLLHVLQPDHNMTAWWARPGWIHTVALLID